MPTAKQIEAQQVSRVFQAALIAYGIDSIVDSLDLWDDVQPTPGGLWPSAGRWINTVLNLVAFRRSEAREIAYTYYRLHRALATGYTYPELGTDVKRETVNLNELRDDFYSQVERAVPGILTDDRELVTPQGEVVTEPPPETDEPVEVEEPESDLEELFDEQDEEAAEEAENQLDNVGPGTLDKKLRLIDDDGPAREVDGRRSQAHLEAGARQAAAVERLTLNGARDAVQAIGEQDRRVQGFARVSSTGTPCGFCAMLISRGVKYKSQESAGEEGGYHDNCKCYGEPVFSRAQYDSDPKFDLNRELHALWKEKDRRGPDGMKVWRKTIRDKYDPKG